MPLMTAKAKELGFLSTVAEWTESETRTITLFAAGHCKVPEVRRAVRPPKK